MSLRIPVSIKACLIDWWAVLEVTAYHGVVEKFLHIAFTFIAQRSDMVGCMM